ncbi:MAG: hypothetical protein AB8I69_09580, partial [Anaerolineae bacterium]
MKNKTRWIVMGVILGALGLLAATTVLAGPVPDMLAPRAGLNALAAPLGTAFTYQGKLENGSGAVTANCEMAFRLYDEGGSGGSQVGSAVTATVPITDGLFTVGLDFGSSVFTGDERWLGIKVQCPGDASFADLGRQKLTATPYAVYALGAPWDGLTGVPADLLDGDDDTTYTAGMGLVLNGTEFSVLSDTVQLRVTGTCSAGYAVRQVNADGSVVCEEDTDTTYSAGTGLDLNGNTFNVTTNTIQQRVTGACAIGSSVRAINADGTVVCWSDSPLNRAAAPSANITTTVDSAGDVGLWTSVTIGADGLPVVSYGDNSSYVLKVLHCGDLSCSSGNIITTVDSTASVASYTSIAVGADGLPVISYHDDTSADLKVLHCGDLLCSSGNISTTVDSAGDVGEWTSIAIGADGLPVVSYRDVTNADLKVLHCGDPLCSSGNISTTVDSSTADTGRMTSIAIGTDGLPLVSYWDASNGDLRALHCGNLLCNSGNISATLDSNGVVGQETSLTIGADGLPVISYRDDTNADLKVLHCGDLLCSSGNISTTVDSAGNVGSYSSITIGSDELPVIGYLDSTNTALKVLHCGNLLCNSSNVITT